MKKSKMFQPTFQKPRKSWYHFINISRANRVRKNVSRPKRTAPYSASCKTYSTHNYPYTTVKSCTDQTLVCLKSYYNGVHDDGKKDYNSKGKRFDENPYKYLATVFLFKAFIFIHNIIKIHWISMIIIVIEYLQVTRK